MEPNKITAKLISFNNRYVNDAKLKSFKIGKNQNQEPKKINTDPTDQTRVKHIKIVKGNLVLSTELKNGDWPP